MNIGELKAMIKDLPDDLQVLIPANAAEGFDGSWFSPCTEESGEIGIGTEDIDEEEIQEREILNKHIETERILALVPCGYYEPKEVDPLMN